MVLKPVTIAISLLLVQTLASNKVQYNGYQVLRTSIPNEAQLEALKILGQKLHLDFWSQPSSKSGAEIMAAPKDLEELKSFLEGIQLDFQVKILDVQSLIDYSTTTKERSDRLGDYELTWDEYYKTEVILDYLQYLAQNYDFVSTKTLATTYENRSVVALEVTRAGEGKKNVFIEGGVHGREWISHAVVTYLIRELVENNAEQYLDNFNFYFVPVFNPDGYNFAHDEDRLWRKTRTREHSSICPGVDLNRNFPFRFGVGGASDNMCEDKYQGPHSFSEPENSALSKYFKGIEPVPELALSFHSARGVVWYPFYSSTEEVQDNVEEVIEVCNEAMDALNAVDNQEFVCLHGGSNEVRGGTSLDWYASQGSRFSFKPTLRDNGYGFLLPPEFIEPSGKENWAALKVMLDKLME